MRTHYDEWMLCHAKDMTYYQFKRMRQLEKDREKTRMTIKELEKRAADIEAHLAQLRDGIAKAKKADAIPDKVTILAGLTIHDRTKDEMVLNPMFLVDYVRRVLGYKGDVGNVSIRTDPAPTYTFIDRIVVARAKTGADFSEAMREAEERGFKYAAYKGRVYNILTREVLG